MSNRSCSSLNAAFSLPALTDLLRPAAQTPPGLVAAIGKLALAGPVLPLAGLASLASAKAILAAIALVCAAGLAVVYMPRPASETTATTPAEQTSLFQAQAMAVQPQQMAELPAAPAPAPAGGNGVAAAVPPPSEGPGSDAAAAEAQLPPAPAAFAPHSCLEEGLENGKVVFSARHFIVSPTIRRSEFTDGRLIIFDLGNRSHLQIDEGRRKAIKQIYADLPPAKHYHPVEILTMNAGPEGPKYVGSKSVDGKECNGFRADNPYFDCTVWFDKTTSLPVRMDGFQKTTGRRIVESEYDFHMDLDPKRFDMTPPDGYEYSEEIVRDTWWSRFSQKAWSWWSWMWF